MMDRARVIEIIEAYGADVAAWPERERAEALVLAGADARLALRLEAAKPMDRLLTGWASAPLCVSADEADAAAELALAAIRVRPARRGWVGGALGGGAVAAALAIGALVLPRESSMKPAALPVPLAAAGSEQALAANDMLVWEAVFTPTPQEETVL